MGNPFRRVLKFFRRLQSRVMHSRKRKAVMERELSMDAAGESTKSDSGGDRIVYPLRNKASRSSINQTYASATSDSDNAHCIVAHIGRKVCNIRGVIPEAMNALRPDYQLCMTNRIKISCPYGDTWDNSMLDLKTDKRVVTGSVLLDSTFYQLQRFGYHPTKILQAGGYGATVLVYSEDDRRHVVMKSLLPYHGNYRSSSWYAEGPPKLGDHMLQVNIHTQLKHPHIVDLFSYQPIDGQIVLKLEYCQNGNLIDLINSHYGKVLSQQVARKYFRELVAGVEYIHQQCIVHLDLRPQNLLLNQFNQLKIADFSMAGFYKKGDQFYRRDVGEWGYKAPETIYRKPYNPRLVDIWAMGCVLFNLISGKIPYLRRCHCCRAQDNMKKGIGHELTKTAVYIPYSLNSLLESMLKHAPQSRASLGEIKSHAWMKSGPNETCISNAGSASSCGAKKIGSSELELRQKVLYQL